MAADEGNKRERSAGAGAVVGVLGRLLPLVSLAGAFVAFTMLYRVVFFPDVDEAPAEPVAAEVPPETLASSSHWDETYEGVDDPWTQGSFTTGNRELDEQVKAFCDALSVEGYSAEDNAQTVYNTIVWSTYEERGEDEQPTGAEWDLAAARHYFSTAVPAEGVGGQGDNYEYAAAISYCLRYFGYGDALAVPVLMATEYGTWAGSALCLFSDEYGFSRLCDPSLGANGWMLDRDSYSVVVEDIGQDLTDVEAMGLNVQSREQEDE